MKAHLSALALTVTTAALLPVVSTGAVIHVEEPQPLELTLGAPVGVDLNQDGSSDITVMYYGMPICIGPPEGGSYLCSLGVTLAFGSDLQLLGDLSSLDPVVMLPGQKVGPVPTQGAWLQTFTSPISLIYEFGTVSHARQGYPDYTGGLDRLAIGFRLAEEQSFRYGYMDVSLATWMPRVEGIVIADQLGVGLTVVQVPEPSIVALTVLGGVVLWFARRRRGRETIAESAEQDHWSEQPPRFSVQRRVAVRMRLVRSTASVGGCRSVLAFGVWFVLLAVAWLYAVALRQFQAWPGARRIE